MALLTLSNIHKTFEKELLTKINVLLWLRF